MDHSAFPLDVLREGGLAGFTSGGETENSGRTFCTAAVTAFLSAADGTGGEGLQPGRDVQRACALRSMDFVGRDGNQVSSQSFCLERHFQKTLHRISVENGIGADSMGQLCHLGDGHDSTAFVVDHHDGYQNGVLAQCCFQSIQRNVSKAIGLQIGHFIPLSFQFLHAVKDGRMLHSRGNNVLAPLTHSLYRGENSPVIRFCAAGGKEHPVGFCAQCGSYFCPGGAHQLGAFHAEVIQRTGVRPVFCHCVHNSLHSLLAGLGGGRIIQINHIVYSSTSLRGRLRPWQSVLHYLPTQNLSKILAVISSLTVAPVTSPIASIASSTSISTASGVRPSFNPCSARSMAS